ncbi:hypothetical protein DSL72_004458 [Monilinia vaccinii-corymbosi]|uniref:F-box domain-containing protein n=1 Tax=Monilinia vaccinii-corymbosi TaxID=61207 RepID=A0A8A3P0K0_9HELO|nr:hypothetical protein DSL72_004458 [Monilinia vaccinii-corymbosi]
MSEENKSGFGLPSECESTILSYVPTSDLFSLSQVSKHFRDLSAAQLYRTFHIVFPDDEDHPGDNSPGNGLATRLDTFVTSDYDYARYVRKIILEPLTGGVKSENAYRSLTFNTACGRFMNTILRLTLRKAHALETFKWDIRVELSREVLKELHDIGALQNLHIRMQKGKSIYDPTKNSCSTPSPYDNPICTPSPVINGMSRTISGFKNLKSLSILDMDDLEYLSEIRACIENSSATLTSLSLSFSEELVSRSKKLPVVVIVPVDDETDTEDGFGILVENLGPDPALNATWSVANTMQTTMQRKAQEAALGEIFGIKPSDSKASANSTRLKKGEPEGEKESSRASKMFSFLKDQVANYMVENKFEMSGELEKTVLEIMAKTSETYIENLGVVSAGESKVSDTNISNQNGSNIIGINGENSESSILVNPTDKNTTTELDESEDQPSLFAETSSNTVTKGSKSKEVMDPDDIDIEEPEVEDLIDDLEIVEGDTTEPETSYKKVPTGEGDLPALKTVDETIAPELVQSSGVDSEEKVEQTVKQVNINKRKSKETDTLIVGAKEGMCEYIRRTRGLALKKFELHLIPMKYSILLKAIDIRVLESITLMSVGSQNSFWIMAAQENKIAPLPLHKIYTDNVTLAFLECVGKLAMVDELCILERKPLIKREDGITVGRATVSMEQIRRLVLKKHVSTLKVLSIHQEHTHNMEALHAWDLDPKTAVLLCRCAEKLEELAAVIETSVIHIINQNISRLKSLRALRIIDFRSADSSTWIHKEFTRFMIDSISQNPDCKLEYLAVKDEITQIYRRVKRCSLLQGRRSNASFVHGKDKVDLGPQITLDGAVEGGSDNISASTAKATGSDEIMMPTGKNVKTDQAASDKGMLDAAAAAAAAAGEILESDSDGEDGVGGWGVNHLGLKIKFRDDLHWHDVEGVRIFEKDAIWKRI